MKRILHSFYLSLIGLFVPFSSMSQTNDSLPNILIIIADDLGIDALEGFDVGTLKPITPHLDSLRAAGVTFINAWATPVCTSTRASTMSGKHGIKTGVLTAPGNLDTTHISIFKKVNLFSNNSYSTAAVGKWHVAQPATEQHPHWHGVDEYMGILSAGWNAYDDWNKTENDVTTPSTDYATSYFTDFAANWINNQNQPWILWLAHIAPHTPLHVPPIGTYSQPSTNSQIKKYFAMIENMDYEIGRLFDSIPQPVLQNTIIFFIGDNGTPDNVLQTYPAGRGKETVYQGGVNVPLIVSGHGVTRAGEIEDALVNVVDIYGTVSTMLDSTLLDSGGVYNSRSFYSLLSDANSSSRDYNYIELGPNNSGISLNAYAIRNTRYKLIQFLDVNDNDSAQAFYDLLVDPYETYDLLTGTLTTSEQSAMDDLIIEAQSIRTGWSCRDGIRNGDETDVDCGGSLCSACNLGISAMNNANRIKIYPNPSKDVVNVRLGSNQKPDDWSISVLNILGKEIKGIILNKTISGFEINLSSLEPQILFLKIYNHQTGIIETHKIIKQ